MALQLVNTLTRTKELFVPRDEGRVGIYLCGPTTYAEPHIGNMRNVVFFDVLRRHLAAEGYDVLYVRNYTDVDDHIIEASGHDALRAFLVAEHWTRVYEDIVAALGTLPPDVSPRATGHIPEMLELVAGLFDAGLAYQAEAEGDVYFAVSKFPEYGRLSRRNLGELRAGERVEVDPAKRDPLDFVLWKAARPGEPTWNSPWGPGRPGWHLECSAMAGKYLGSGFDIHGGGEDLIFPHHENEIAQWTGATGEPFARYWLHNAFLELRGEKMAKSVGNVMSPRELLRHYRGAVVRLSLLSAHYRHPLEFSVDVLDDAAAAYDKLATFAVNAARALGVPTGEGPAADGAGPGSSVAGPAGSVAGPGGSVAGPGGSVAGAGGDASTGAFADRLVVGEDAQAWVDRFVAALDDDLAVPAAMSVLFDLVGEANPLIAATERGHAQAGAQLRGRLAAFNEMTGRLGFSPLLDLPAPASIVPVLDLVLELREQARQARDFATADRIRSRLANAGIRVEDRVGGARWHLGA